MHVACCVCVFIFMRVCLLCLHSCAGGGLDRWMGVNHLFVPMYA